MPSIVSCQMPQRLSMLTGYTLRTWISWRWCLL